MYIKTTDSELEILDLLWQNGPSSVREIHNQLNQKRELYYTTTLKTMQLMHEKGMLDRDTSQRSHVYSVKINKDDVEKSLIDKLANSVFKGSAGQLIMSALGHSTPSKEELKEIKALINKLDQNESS